MGQHPSPGIGVRGDAARGRSLIKLATWKAYPDRVDALWLLREIARSEWVRVWRYGADGQLVYDQRRSRQVRRALLGPVQQHVSVLLGSWRQESEAVRRAQLWLLSALPAVVDRYRDLVAAVLPADYQELWRALLAGEELDEEQEDRLWELEGWLEASDEDG